MNRELILITIILLYSFSTDAQTIYSTPSDCLSKCVTTGSIFCPNTDMTKGYCCTTPTEKVSCPRQFQYCSGDFLNSTTMTTFMCPYQSSMCGASTFL